MNFQLVNGLAYCSQFFHSVLLSGMQKGNYGMIDNLVTLPQTMQCYPWVFQAEPPWQLSVLQTSSLFCKQHGTERVAYFEPSLLFVNFL